MLPDHPAPFCTSIESSKSPASIAQRNKQWVGTCLLTEPDIDPLLYFFSIDQYMSDYTGQLKGTAVYNDDISVFSFLQGTDTVCDTDVFCRVDGYGPERIVFIHSGLDCKARAKREIVERNYRRVGDDGDMTTGVCKDSRSFPGLILNCLKEI